MLDKGCNEKHKLPMLEVMQQRKAKGAKHAQSNAEEDNNPNIFFSRLSDELADMDDKLYQLYACQKLSDFVMTRVLADGQPTEPLVKGVYLHNEWLQVKTEAVIECAVNLQELRSHWQDIVLGVEAPPTDVV